jgi:hypothetical protein
LLIEEHHKEGGIMSTSAGILMVTPLLLATVITGPDAAMASSASYVPGNGVCEDGELCLYSGIGQSGDIYDVAPCDNLRNYRRHTYINSSRRLNDSVDSVWNLSGYVYEFYSNPGYRGESETVFSGKRELYVVDDEVSSHQCTGS